MAITNAHLHWFNLKCPHPQGSKAFRMAKAKLDNATAADLARLRAEFALYKDGSIPVTHYSLYDEWFASVGSVKTEQVNMKGIQRHGTKYRVQNVSIGSYKGGHLIHWIKQSRKGMLSLPKLMRIRGRNTPTLCNILFIL